MDNQGLLISGEGQFVIKSVPRMVAGTSGVEKFAELSPGLKVSLLLFVKKLPERLIILLNLLLTCPQ